MLKECLCHHYYAYIEAAAQSQEASQEKAYNLIEDLWEGQQQEGDRVVD